MGQEHPLIEHDWRMPLSFRNIDVENDDEEIKENDFDLDNIGTVNGEIGD